VHGLSGAVVGVDGNVETVGGAVVVVTIGCVGCVGWPGG
jgi:hypothetical protein